MFYVAYFPVHGLKCVQARSLDHAKAVFTKNNGGLPPMWVTRIPRMELVGAMALARLGWRGSVEKFNRDLMGA